MPESVEQLGGRYSARVNPDGTMDIFNVPIVGELAKGERKDLPDFEITEEWLQAALSRAQLRFNEGYSPPLHVRHHGPEFTAPRAGFFVPRSVADFQMNGKPTKTLFADLLRVPKETADKVLQGQLPYCSVEILNVNGEPEIDSLALLDSEPPQFRFPLITIGKLIRSTDSVARHPVGDASLPAVAFASFPEVNAATALFRYPRSGGIKMAAEEEKKDEKLAAATEEKKDEKLQADASLGGEMPAWGEKLVASICAGLEASLAKHFAAKPAVEDAPKLTATEAPKEEPTQLDGAGKPAFIDPTMEEKLAAKAAERVSAQFAGQIAEAKGEITALKAAARAKESAQTRDALVAKAMKDLEGYNLDQDETRKEITGLAAKFGAEAVDTYVGAIKRTPKDPAGSFESFEGTSADAPEVAKFQAMGPGALATARQLERNWNQLRQRGAVRMTLERYLECNKPYITKESVA